MNRLPLEILEMILDKILWENPGELYRLRAVSHLWKSVAERSSSRVFKYWYNRCKKEIPEDYLVDIIQAKYPLVAQPWQEFYWVNSGLPHVPKNAYHIWKIFPDLEETTLNLHWPYEGFSDAIDVGMNDKYLALSFDDDNDDEPRGTRIYPWNNLDQHIRQYDIISNQIDFYTTKKGTFTVLAKETCSDYKIYISKYPIDKMDLSSELIYLGRVKKYFITQNECFYISEDDSIHLNILEHKILTEQGFETSTIIELPAEMPRYEWDEFRVEICGCTLYFLQNAVSKLSITKYKISRNSEGKLSFTLDEWKVLDYHYHGLHSIRTMYMKMYSLFGFHIYSQNLHLTDFTFALEKFWPRPWISWIYHEDIRPLAAHANFVFCVKDMILNHSDRLCIFQKDNLIESRQANDPEHLKRATINIIDCQNIRIKWIGIIYIGLKAKMLVQYDNSLCLIDFY